MSKNTLLMVGGINEEMTERVLGFLSSCSQRAALKVVICSHGGSCIQALAIYDALVDRGATITALGEASSAAALILQAGKKRLMAPNSRMLLHPIAKEIPCDYVGYLVDEAGEATRIQKLFGKLMEERSGMKGFWKRFGNGSHYLTPGEALGLNLIDGIVGG